MPTMSLAAKAQMYQASVEAEHQSEDGVIRYRYEKGQTGSGNLPDGSFFMGIYTATQALRYTVTQSPEARAQLLLSLDAMELYAKVTGRRGLLPRYVSREKPDDERWQQSTTCPEFFWRRDVSKDQYAGYVHGLGVTFAVVQDPEIRRRIASLAAALADHLIEHDLIITDVNDKPTRFSVLRAKEYGFPAGVNALISLAIAKTAAVSNPEPRYEEFYERLVRERYVKVAGSAHWEPLGIALRVNDNMSYLALYPLLLLETDPELLLQLRQGGRRTWVGVGEDRNAFFSFVHAAVVGDARWQLEPGQEPGDVARERGRVSLREFPEDKASWSVDLTREGFDFPRAFLNSKNCEPRSTQAIPVYLRYRGSNMWVSDPYQLVGRLGAKGERRNSGCDYLIAYWIGRYHGFVAANE